jgi:hypothetical protein
MPGFDADLQLIGYYGQNNNEVVQERTQSETK